MRISATRIVFILVITAVIYLNLKQIEVSETLKNIAIAIVSFYFWQKNLNSNTWKNENNSI